MYIFGYLHECGHSLEVLKNGDKVRDGRPAIAYSQANALQPSSTAALEWRLSPKC